MSSYLDDDVNGGVEVSRQVADLAHAQTPRSVKGLRACKRCGMLKTYDQFVDEGCDNCMFLEMTDDPEKVNLCTTAFFEGQVAIMDPRASWTAKWLRVDNYLPGVYAINVTGTFNKDIEEELEQRGCRYRCRPADA
jgi:transcription elongation factor SPT4